MKLKTKQVNNFLKLSSSIVPNNILPILAYIKLQDGKLVKTNLKAFVSHKIDVPQKEEMLLDEKVVVAFLRDCKSDEIEVKVEGKSVFLIDGKRKMKFQSEDIANFPVFPESEKEKEVELDEEVLQAIGIAAKNVGQTGMGEKFDFVHLDKDCIVGTDRAKFFCKKIKGIPSIVLDTQTANTVAQFSSVNFYQRGTYNFFEVGNTLYGFVQAEVKTPVELASFIPKEQPADFMEFNVNEFVGFCDTVLAASANKVSDCVMKGNKLSFIDTDYDINYDTELNTTGTFEPKMTFIPKTFGAYFKSLGFEKVKLAKTAINNQALSVWSDEDSMFVGLIIGVFEKQ